MRQLRNPQGSSSAIPSFTASIPGAASRNTSDPTGPATARRLDPDGKIVIYPFATISTAINQLIN